MSRLPKTNFMFPFEFTLNICPAPECGHKYVLLASWEGVKDGSWMEQELIHNRHGFCPYCGMNYGELPEPPEQGREMELPY